MSDKPKSNKVNNLLKGKNYTIVMVAILVLTVLIGGYVIYWLAGRYTKQSNLNKAQDQLIASLEQKQKDLNALKSNYDAITAKGSSGVSDAELILRAMPISQDYENLLAILERMGQESGVKVTNVSQDSSEVSADTSSTGGSSAQPFVFNVNVEGSYAALLDFLNKTEQSARIINFNNMSINGKSGNITAELTMTTFFKPNANINSTFVPLR